MTISNLKSEDEVSLKHSLVDCQHSTSQTEYVIRPTSSYIRISWNRIFLGDAHALGFIHEYSDVRHRLLPTLQRRWVLGNADTDLLSVVNIPWASTNGIFHSEGTFLRSDEIDRKGIGWPESSEIVMHNREEAAADLR